MSDLLLGHRTGGGSSKTDISTATVTLQTQSFTYDGTIKTRNVNSVVLNGQTLTAGTDYVVIGNKAVNVGTYKLLVAGIGDYDGFVSADWSINKAQGSISVSPSSLTIQGAAGSTDTATLTVVGDGTISVQSSNSNVATATRSGNTVTVTSVGNGSATITITLAAGINYTGSSATISVSVSTVSATLADNTPAQIQDAAQAGTASSLWSVGDRTAPIILQSTKTFSGDVLSINGLGACAFIIGFEHNNTYEGNGIHFQFGKTTNGIDISFYPVRFNEYDNISGWPYSDNYYNDCPNFFSALPSEWQEVIVDCDKYTNVYSNNYQKNVIKTSSKIFLLAYFEIFGSEPWTYPNYSGLGEESYQEQYAYYANGNSKIKYKHNDTTTGGDWWTRSTYNNGSSMYVVMYNGSDATMSKTGSCGFAPGFRVA